MPSAAGRKWRTAPRSRGWHMPALCRRPRWRCSPSCSATGGRRWRSRPSRSSSGISLKFRRCPKPSVSTSGKKEKPVPVAEAATPPWLAVHPLSQEDSLGATALRASVAAFKGKLAGTAARGPFNDLMERVAAPTDVTFEADTVGGISGLWAKPARPHKGAAILHVHGGWFNLGTAHAYRNFVGHIASSAGADAFIPDYRLAPEHPFPAAVTDV